MKEETNAARSEHDELLDHEYDGIREYDNPLPRWWVWTFWGSFWFAGLYFLQLHVFDKSDTATEAYAAEMEAFREAEAKRLVGQETSEESLAKLMNNEGLMADTKGLWIKRCEQCHDAEGQGKIGPNLTDDQWIHGKGKLMDIYEVVAHGVPSKGMPAWDRQLTPIELSKLVAYVGAMRGKNLPGKAPEGEKVDLNELLEGAPQDTAPGAKAEPGATVPTGLNP